MRKIYMGQMGGSMENNLRGIKRGGSHASKGLQKSIRYAERADGPGGQKSSNGMLALNGHLITPG